MKGENKSIIITSIICGVILLVALAFLFTSQTNKTIENDSITVQGVSIVNVIPDLISVYFTIDTKGDTSKEANDLNTGILDNFTKSLIANGYDESIIKTENFNIYPNTYWENNKMKEDGFKATRSLKVELNSTEFDKISNIIDLGVNAGAGISYINFELSPEAQNKYKAKALELAAQDAKVKAESVASGFGKSLGKLVSAQVNDFNYYPFRVYSTSASGTGIEDTASAKEAVASITPSDQDVTASISATYKMR